MSRWTVDSRVLCGSRLATTTMMSSLPSGRVRRFEKAMMFVVDVVERDVAQPVQGGVLAADLVDPREVPGQRLALLRAAGLVVLPVAVLVLVLLVVDLLLGT